MSERAQAEITVVDACRQIVENGGWGAMQEITIRNATAADFESAIRSADIKTLQKFMRRMIEMRIHRQNYDQHFGTSTEKFVDACRNIVNDPRSSRLGGLIKRLFDATPIASELPPLQTTTG